MVPRSIVCPLVPSPDMAAAFVQARALARWYDATLHLVEVRPGSAADLPTVSRVADGGKATDAAAHVHAVLPPGDPCRRIVEYARSVEAELIVTARPESRWSGNWARELAREAFCPVLLVPPAVNVEANVTFQNIVCGVEFDPSSMPAVEAAVSLAQQSGGRLTLLHVMEGYPYESIYSASRALALGDEFRARVRQITRELSALVPPDAALWCEIAVEVMSGTPHDGILSAAEARGADLIVIGAPRRTALDRLARRSTVSGVVNGARGIVLAVPGAGARRESRVPDDRLAAVS